MQMHRRLFMQSLFGLAGAVVGATLLTPRAQAMPFIDPLMPLDEDRSRGVRAAIATPEDLDQAEVEDVRWRFGRRRFFFRRRRRFFFRRRRFFFRRRRRFFFRRRRF
jgi:hypothetical protein